MPQFSSFSQQGPAVGHGVPFVFDSPDAPDAPYAPDAPGSPDSSGSSSPYVSETTGAKGHGVSPSRKKRPRRLFFEDDGISVPWLSSLVAVFILAMLNTHFWQHVVRTVFFSGFEKWLYIGMLFVLLACICAFVCNCVTVRSIGKPLLVCTLLLASLSEYIHGVYGDDGLLIFFYKGPTELPFVLSTFFLKIVLLGIVPAAILFWVPVGRRYAGREWRRRVRYAMFCGVLALGIFIIPAYRPMHSMYVSRAYMLVEPAQFVYAGYTAWRDDLLGSMKRTPEELLERGF